MTPEEVDLLVVGTGSAGLTIAQACRKAGWSVVAVDKQPFGGTCALRGCDPKKVLVGAAHAVRQAARLVGHGVAEAPRLDWPALMRFKETFTDPVPEARAKSLGKAGIETLRGIARFTAPDRVEVEGRAFAPRHVALAAGAKPRPLGIPGEDLVSTSTDFLSLPELPHRVAFLGGGYVSMEFAHVARAAGAEVTVLHRGARILEPFDADLARMLEGATRGAGIDLRLRTEARAVGRKGGALVVHARSKGGEESSVEADLVVHGAGRVPDLDDLDLDAGRVERSERGVVVDAHLRSVSNPRVFAAGDAAAAGPPLTPVAGLQGETVAHNLLHPDAPREASYAGVASVAFTDPPLAAVGHTEESARGEGLDVDVAHADSTGWYSAKRLRAPASGHKVLVEKGSGRIVGAHLLGPEAEEAINVFALAVRLGLTKEQLDATPFAYPTRGSDVTYMLP